MSTRIGLIGDPHATAAPVAKAVSLLRAEGVDRILCTGDIAGYGNELDETVDLLIEAGCTAILGNHESWYLEKSTDRQDTRNRAFFEKLPAVVELNVEGVRLYMVHASPPRSDMEGIRLLDVRGDVLPESMSAWSERLQGFDYDVLVVGHTHQVFAERLADTLVVNPGSTKFNHSCAILDLPSMVFQVLPLSGKNVVKSWNWGVNQITRNNSG